MISLIKQTLFLNLYCKERNSNHLINQYQDLLALKFNIAQTD